MHNATSHFTHLDLRVTPRSEHTRHHLLVGLRPGQCLLWHAFNLIHNDFTYLVPRRLTSPFSTKTHYVPFCKQEKQSHQLQQQTLNCIQTIICKPVNGKLACPFYSYYPGASEPKRFYDLNIPLATCRNNIPAQRILRTYDTYALKASKDLRLG